MLTTVSVQDLSKCSGRYVPRDCMPLGLALWGWLDPAVDVVPREAIVGPEETDEEVDRRNAQDWEQSQLLAAAAALTLLGYQVQAPRGVLVQGVEPGLPAAASLRAGDVIIAAEGRVVCGLGDLGTLIGERGAGGKVTVRVDRGGRVFTQQIAIVRDPERPEKPVIGVRIASPRGEIKLPINVEFKSSQIGGPSAGLMFALGIYDRVSPVDLAAGRSIAGTGTITSEGCVGAVGGLPQKIVGARKAGADLFLVPQPELEQACPLRGEMQVYGVRTLEEAVAVLRGSAPEAGTCA
jgi:PDZ domain-containing protein